MMRDIGLTTNCTIGKLASIGRSCREKVLASAFHPFAFGGDPEFRP